MKIEELMPSIRAGKKIRLTSWPPHKHMWYVRNSGHLEFLGFSSKGGFYLSTGADIHECSLHGNDMLANNWELYDESTQSV